MTSNTGIGRLIGEHYRSLPYDGEARRFGSWPWVVTFFVVPAIGAGVIGWVGLAPARSAAVALLAGLGVLGGLLFQVLAWVSGRIGAIADSVDEHAPDASRVELITRLDDARANIAYATFVDIVLVVWLGAIALLDSPPSWTTWVSAFLTFHFALTLILMLLRINAIGRSDRIDALTKHARRRR